MCQWIMDVLRQHDISACTVCLAQQIYDVKSTDLT